MKLATYVAGVGVGEVGSDACCASFLEFAILPRALNTLNMHTWLSKSVLSPPVGVKRSQSFASMGHVLIGTSPSVEETVRLSHLAKKYMA